MSPFAEYIGYKVVCHTLDGKIYCGFIQTVDEKSKSITLFRVSVNGGEPVDKLSTFYTSELIELELLDEVNETLRRSCLSKQDLKRCGEKLKGVRDTQKLVKVRSAPVHLKELSTLDPLTLTMQPVVQQEMEKTKDENGHIESILPAGCTLLDDCHTELFKQAIEHLKSFSVVGVSFDGVGLGRNGKLCWILMTTGQRTMFFDFKTMGSECLDAGIKHILISADIEKVIHDCRLSSDLLYHQFDIKLRNVFDTMVAVAEIFKMENKAYPRYVTSLQECLHRELGIDRGQLHYQLVRPHDPQRDEEVWGYRPVPTVVYKWLLSHCQHLVTLRRKLDADLKVAFKTGCDHFLSNCRDVSGPEAILRAENRHLLPTEFQDIDRLLAAIIHERKERRNRQVSLKYIGSASHDPATGFLENCTGISQPTVVGSNDSIWHHAKEAMPNKLPFKNTKSQCGDKHSLSSTMPEYQRKKVRGRLLPSSDMEPVLSSKPTLQTNQRLAADSSHSDSNTAAVAASMSGCLKSRFTHLALAESPALTLPLTDSLISGGSTHLELAESPALTLPRTDSLISSGSTHSASAVSRSSVNSSLLDSSKSDLFDSWSEDGDEDTAGMRKQREICPAMSYHLRPAGETQFSTPQITKKSMRVESLETYAVTDLGRQKPTSTSSGSPGKELMGSEFDMIPSHRDLTLMRSQKCASSSEHMSFLVHCDRSEAGDSDSDFFVESIPTPSFFVADDKSLRRQKYKASETSECEEDPLSAILPRVGNKLEMLRGSRANVHRTLATMED